MSGSELQAAQVAQAVPDGGGGAGGLGFFLPLVAMFLLFYALIIRPQSRQQKAHRQMLSEIRRGDQVVTSGGIHGKVTGVSDDVLTVEIADRVRVRLNRSAVSSRVVPGDQKDRDQKDRDRDKEKAS